MRTRVATAALALGFVLAACSGGSGDRTPTQPPATPGASAQTGSAAVGERVYTFVDRTRGTQPRTGPHIPTRTLRTKVFYPAAGTATGSPRPNAEPLTTGPYPVVLFSHGFGGSPDGFTGLFRQWIRAGVVIVAPYYPLTNRQSPQKVLRDGLNQPADASFVLTQVLQRTTEPSDPLHGLLDSSRIVAAGHSLGATTTVALFKKCCRESRLDGGIVLAGSDRLYGEGNWAPPPAPILFEQGTEDALVPYSQARSTYDDLPWPKAFVTLEGADHSKPYIALSSPYGQVVVRTTVDYLDWVFNGRAGALTALQRDATVPGIASYTGTLSDTGTS